MSVERAEPVIRCDRCGAVIPGAAERAVMTMRLAFGAGGPAGGRCTGVYDLCAECEREVTYNMRVLEGKRK